jgi:hypothetical protein
VRYINILIYFIYLFYTFLAAAYEAIFLINNFNPVNLVFTHKCKLLMLLCRQEFSASLPKSKTSSTFPSLPKPSSASALAATADVTLLHQLRRMFCVNAQARAVLAVCGGLPVDWSLDLLELCLNQDGVQLGLKEALKKKRHFVSVYQRVGTKLFFFSFLVFIL